jgi:predicted Rossmann fold nucleotide-binding protein DprA/Smf involved in DNA uptake
LAHVKNNSYLCTCSQDINKEKEKKQKKKKEYMRERKQHISRLDRVYNNLLKYPTHPERVWELLTVHLKDITYQDYLVLYDKLQLTNDEA